MKKDSSLRYFFEEVMINFQSENKFFITEGDDDHFVVIITLCPLL